MVVTRLNATEVGDFDRLARGYGAKTRLSRFRPSGGGCHTWEDYRLTREQLARALGVPRRPPGDPHRRLVLRPHARQPPEPGAQHVRRRQDDLRRGPRRQRLPLRLPERPGVSRRQRRPRSRSGRHLRGRRRCSSASATLEVEACRGCDRFSICHGGCPAVGYFLTESMGLPDPECLRAVEPCRRRQRGAASAPRTQPAQGGGLGHAVPQPVQPSADRAGDGRQPHLVLGPPHQPGRERAAQRAADGLPGGPRARAARGSSSPRSSRSTPPTGPTSTSSRPSIPR